MRFLSRPVSYKHERRPEVGVRERGVRAALKLLCAAEIELLRANAGGLPARLQLPACRPKKRLRFRDRGKTKYKDYGSGQFQEVCQWDSAIHFYASTLKEGSAPKWQGISSGFPNPDRRKPNTLIQNSESLGFGEQKLL
jgi:hypothetical protein